jgi:NhaA family Na+:H+ antiporter
VADLGATLRSVWQVRRRAREFVQDRAFEAAQAFLRTEAAGGIALLLAALAALAWANSPWDRAYDDLWSTALSLRIGNFGLEDDLRHAVNDGLMTVFFFVVGLEIKRELVRGELAERSKAVLPVAAALGGMVLPALIYFAFNPSGTASRGWGIPMATDIAFAVGVLSLLGTRVPFGLKIFLLSLAIVDDLGAIVVIAVFYTGHLAMAYLAAAVGLFLLMAALNVAGYRSILLYLTLGVLIWVAAFKSGVHATIAGAAMGLLTPSRPHYEPSSFAERVEAMAGHFRGALARGDPGDQEELLREVEDLAQGSEAPLERLERSLHPWVSYVIMPLFALANAGVVIDSQAISGAVSSSTTHGVVLGLVLGKTLGISLAALLAARSGLASLPTGTRPRHILGAAMLGGIGFTVSIFITGLAFATNGQVAEAKLGIFFASLLAGVAGFLFLRFSGPPVEASSSDSA